MGFALKLGELTATLSSDTDNYIKGLKDAERKAKEYLKTLTKIHNTTILPRRERRRLQRLMKKNGCTNTMQPIPTSSN